ncbi:MAG: sugar phosphate isomerase/epimerase [Proteobacteria bacterium]|nr:sugar phosphate isomerase/epimerase [Pseudomonadota bacterium]
MRGNRRPPEPLDDRSRPPSRAAYLVARHDAARRSAGGGTRWRLRFDGTAPDRLHAHLVRASGMYIAVLGTEYGLLFAEGAERQRLFDVFALTCSNAVAMGCPMIMTAPGQNNGTVAQAALSLREAAQIASDHGLRLALEFNSQHDVINHIEVAREIIAKAAHPAAGLLIDAYHLQRSGSPGRGFEHVAPEEIFTFQYSDVPAGPPPGQRRPTDRLVPGEGIVQWQAVFDLLREKGYGGYLSFEAPNPALWERPPAEVAREAADATRRLLAG